MGECISRFQALKRLLFKFFFQMEYCSRYWTQQIFFLYGMDNSEKVTFDLKISGKNKCTVTYWSGDMAYVKKQLLGLRNREITLDFA